jgi:hypothetical protein
LHSVVESKDDFILHYNEKDSKKIHSVMTLVLPKIDQFQRKIGNYPHFKVPIHFAHNHNEYKTYTQNYKSEILEFSSAFFSSKEKSIFVKDFYSIPATQQISDIILHEYIHVFIHHYFPNAPLWFHEGMAVYYSSGISTQREYRAIYDQLSDYPLQIYQMQNKYPKNRNEWEAFYGKSAITVRYLSTTYKKAMLDFWHTNKTGQNFYHRFQRYFFMNQFQITQRMNTYMNAYAKRAIIIVIFSLLPIFIPFVLIVSWIRRKIQFSKLPDDPEVGDLDKQKVD